MIIYNRILTLLDGHEVHHSGDQRVRYTRARDIEYLGREPLSSFDWAVQFDRCGELSVPSKVELETNLFCVRRIEQP